jgi:membrane protein involved in colicin uptake
MARMTPAPKGKNAPSAKAVAAGAKFASASKAGKAALNAKANAFAAKLSAGKVGPGTGSNSGTGGAG